MLVRLGRVLLWVDNRVLDGVTRVAHGIQKRTGRTSYWLARHGLVLSVLEVLVAHVLPALHPYGIFLDDDPPSSRVLVTVVNLLACVTLYRDARTCERADQSLTQTDVVQRPTFLVDHLWLRLGGLLQVGVSGTSGILVELGRLPPWTAAKWVHALSGVNFACVLYLLAVVPLPPGAVRDRATRSSRLVPAPAPSPSK